MSPNSIFGIRHWDLPQILFVGAACFAMAAVGFFIAVFLQLNFGGIQGSSGANAELLPIEEKQRIAEQLSAKAQTQQIPPDIMNQSDPGDADAAEKIRMMQNLSQ